MVFWKKKKEKEKDPKTSAPKPTTEESVPSRKRHSVEVKLLAAQARDSGLNSGEIAKLVGASSNSVDKWWRLYRDGGPEALVTFKQNPKTRKLCAQLQKKIEQYRLENPTHGVRRIHHELYRNDGLEVSPETVRQVVNEAGLGNEPPKSKRKPPQIRRFERELPNAMWQIDIFTFELKRMYKVYLVGMIDDHSRYIVGHGLFRQQKSEAVMEVVKGAIGQWGAPREILSDNGRQFATWRGKTPFQKTLTRQGIQHVRSAPHHPMTLGKIERFWRTIWEEFLEDAVFASFADARQRVDHWISYYNHQRPHQGIDGACPADRFYGVAGDVEEALKQGCKDNALKLALGQETRPPLYLLGKLGETDVRVTRKGDDIEVMVGDTVNELIRMGPAFELDANGNSNREEADDAMEGPDGGGEASNSGDGEEKDETDNGAVRDVWGVASDADQGDSYSGSCHERGTGAEEAGPQGQELRGSEDYRALEESILFGERGGALEDPV